MSSKRVAVLGAAAFLGLASGFAWGDTFNKLVGSGTAVPGQATTFTGVNLAGVDGSFGTAFIGNFSLNATNYSGLYRYQNGQVSTLADRGTVGPAGETINSILANGDYENGVIVFAANTTLGPTLYRYTPGQPLAALVRQGDVLPGSTAAVGTFFNRGVGGDANEFAFRTTRNDGSNGMYQSVSGFGMQVVDDKTRSGVAEMGNFIDFPELHYRDGKTAFVGTGRDPDDLSAPPEPAGVFVTFPGNPFQLIAGRNMPIPNAHDDGERFNEFERPRILPDGRVGFAGGFIEEEGPTAGDHHMGVWIRNPDLTWKIYIDSDMNLPGLHSPILEFNQYSVEGGMNFFGVNDENDGSYIYYESRDGVFTHLIDTYETLDGKAMSRIRMLGDTALGGEVFFRVDFTDGTSGVYSAVVPEPASLGLIGAASMALLARRRRCD
jgi:hypothetical protein